MDVRNGMAVPEADTVAHGGGSRGRDADSTQRRDPEYHRATPASEPSGFAGELRKMLASLARLI